MSTTYNYDRFTSLKAERDNLLATAKSTLANAKAASRDLNPAEVAQMEATVARIGVVDAEVKAQSAAMPAAIFGLANAENNFGEGTGDFFTDAAKTGILHAVKTRTTYRTEVPSKAVVTSGTLLPTSGKYTEPGLHPNSQFPLIGLFPNQPADGPSQRYYRTTSGTAAVVAEGALKPDAGVSFAAVDLLLSKLACTANFSDEMQEDAGFLLMTLQQELVAAVIAAQNKLVIDTFAATSGVLTATGVGTTIIDMIADAISAQESISGTTPNAIIANPTVIATIRKSKASTSGVYNTDVLSASPSMLHGVQLVSSSGTCGERLGCLQHRGRRLHARPGDRGVGPQRHRLGDEHPDRAGRAAPGRRGHATDLAVQVGAHLGRTWSWSGAATVPSLQGALRWE